MKMQASLNDIMTYIINPLFQLIDVNTIDSTQDKVIVILALGIMYGICQLRALAVLFIPPQKD